LNKFLLIVFIFNLISLTGISQTTIISGQILDASTGEPVPFANIYFRTTQLGTTTDFEGYYKITTNTIVDSLVISFTGYKRKFIPVINGTSQVINVRLEPEVISLEELVFVAEENPAYRIMRLVMDHKSENDKRSLDFFEYESYNRIEISLNNLSDKFREKKLVHHVLEKLDSIQIVKDENDRQILPIFVSETLSQYFVKNDPESRKEKILKTRISGVGIEDGSLISQLTGSSFQEYNFYKNWMNILEKEFISPIADGWKFYYDYELVDSIQIEGTSCYQLNVYPRNEEDLAFTGTIWITRDTYALKQLDVTVTGSANLNFIESIKIQQVLNPTKQGPWLPSKTRVIIRIKTLSENSAGLLAKFYISNTQWETGREREGKFYYNPIELNEDYQAQDIKFWDVHRHDSLSAEEKQVFSLVDSLTDIPVVKTYSDIIKTISNGYFRRGKFDFGPILYAYSYNDIEGHRIRLGLRLNEYFSQKFTFRAYGAYGFNDRNFKYGIVTSYIFNRKRWTELIYAKRYDIDQVGLPWSALTENYFFLALTRFGTLNQPYFSDINGLRLTSNLGAGFTQNITFWRESFSPLYNFAYYKELQPGNGDIASDFINSTISYELRYARDETFLINGNQRISTGIRKAPAITGKYTYGLKGVLGGDFEYHRLDLTFEHKIKLGLLGVSQYKISAGKVFNPVPYPLLEVHIGNETIFYTTAAYNLMDYFEFVSDTYTSLRYLHHFEGFILNRIPLMRKLKWRMVGNANVLWGSVNQLNKDLIPEFDLSGAPIQSFQSLGNMPYIELGYGIENILKIIRIDFFHRLTYLDTPNARPFGVKISFQLIL
jgi:hypothetical protein